MKIKILNILCTLVLAIQFLAPVNIYAEESEDVEQPEIGAVSGILIDQDTGRVLYEKNADEKHYPASMTKVLTALICTENIKDDDIVTVGTEINYTPLDSSRAGLEVGESISGKNLIRALIIPSGNEAANTVAMEVVRRKTGDENISYEDAELQFADIMNERAKSLGATNTHFVTPSGYHDDDHYTTARDLALIATEAMKNDTIREVASEVSYTGPSVEEGATSDMKIVEHSWYTHNQIINPSNPYYYSKATGLKTGYTSLAGDCLVATATDDDTNLLLVLFNDEEPQQWIDAATLFDFGFDNYSRVDLQEDGATIQQVAIDNPIKGTDETLDVLANETVTSLLTDAEAPDVVYNITYNPTFLSDTYTETGSPMLKTPILAGQEIGTITYTLGNEILYEGSVIAANDINKRTILTDIIFYSGKLKDIIFSWLIVPIAVSVLFIALYVIRGLKNRKKRARRKRVKYKSKYNNFKRRY